jgi:hypothetical protein
MGLIGGGQDTGRLTHTDRTEDGLPMGDVGKAVRPRATRASGRGASKSITPSPFLKYLEQVPGILPPMLPLIHITEWQYARPILQGKTIATRRCDYFSKHLKREEHLAYCFYGRPAYRPRAQLPALKVAAAPIAFIFQLDMSRHTPCRIYPFDSGAFFEKMYAPHFETSWTSPDAFLLGNDTVYARRLVKAFYGRNRSYVDSQASKIKPIDGAYFEADAYANLISDTSTGRFDNRASTIEFQFDQPITLNRANLASVIVPEILIRPSGEAKRLIEDVVGKGKYVTYPIARGSTSEWYGGMSTVALLKLRKML